MVSPKQLLSTIETVLLSSSPPTPAQRVELMHAIRSSRPAFRSLLSYPVRSLHYYDYCYYYYYYYYYNLFCLLFGPSTNAVKRN